MPWVKTYSIQPMSKKYYCIAIGLCDPYSKHIVPINEFKNNESFQGTFTECKNYVFSETKTYFKSELPMSLQKCYNRPNQYHKEIYKWNILNYQPDNMDEIEESEINILMNQDVTNENVIIKVMRENENDTISGFLLVYATNGGLCIEISYILIPINDITDLLDPNNLVYYLVPIPMTKSGNFNFKSEYKYPIKLFNLKMTDQDKDQCINQDTDLFFIGTMDQCMEQLHSNAIKYFDQDDLPFPDFQHRLNIKCNIFIREDELIIKNCKPGSIEVLEKNDTLILKYDSLHYFMIPLNHPSMPKIQ